jgi:diguanylate cyclase (GGDEF)-like protein
LTGTLRGSGPFASTTPNGTLLSLQTFMGVVAVTSMVIAASTFERARVTAEVERSREELEAANAQLIATCVSDPLTGVANRRGFEVRLAEELARAKRGRAPLSLLIVDVDRFRRHNQALGHGGADAVLKQVADLLDAEIRGTDYLARFGGDEFVILLPDTAIQGAHVIAERCRRRIAAHAWERRAVTVSIGIGAVRPDTIGGPELLADADQALFKAKGSGRNRVAHATAGGRAARPEEAAAG